MGGFPMLGKEEKQPYLPLLHVKSAAGLKEYIEEGLAPSQHDYFVAWLMLKP